MFLKKEKKRKDDFKRLKFVFIKGLRSKAISISTFHHTVHSPNYQKKKV